MEHFRPTSSIKVKLLSTLVGLTSVMLIIYAFLALKIFEKDKIAYVFDTIRIHSKSTSQLVHSEVQQAIDKVDFLMRGYNYENKQFHPYTKRIFLSEKNLFYLSSYQLENNSYQKAESLNRFSSSQQLTDEINSLSESMIEEALISDVSLRTFKQNPSYWLIALNFKSTQSQSSAVILAAFEKAQFIDSIINSNLQDTFLLNRKFEPIIRSNKPIYNQITRPDTALLHAAEKTGAQGTTEYKINDEQKLLLSFSKVNLGNLYIASYVPKSIALEAINELIIKSILFLGLIVCVTLFISVLASNKMTASLKKLYAATQQIATGQLDVELNIKSKDEIGGLAHGFQHMAQEIKRLLNETKEKTRMESELKTAHLVQSTLFPEPSFKSDSIDVVGYYESASECGGDWWYYNTVNNSTYLWIGDATGHGVPAALVTSAARSAATILQELPDLSPHQILGMLNRSIYGVAKGQVLMTFFFAKFDHKTKVLTYSSASHDPPYLFPYKDEKLKKRDIKPLMDSNGPRLGEDLNSTYEESTVQLTQKDRIVFYTDGIPELADPNGTQWGERKFLKTLLDEFNIGSDISTVSEALLQNIKIHRDGHPLEDDVTFFMTEIK